MPRTKQVSGAELANYLAAARQQANRNRYTIQVTDDDQILLPSPTPVVQMGNIGNDGILYEGNATGSMPVVEDSASQASDRIQLTYYSIGYGRDDLFGTAPFVTAQMENSQHRIMCASVTATAGGEIAVVALVPALAGYQSAMMLKRIWSDQTDGSINLTIDTTTGLNNGPGALTIATTANLINPDYAEGIPYYGSADNEAITVLAAAGQTVANQQFWFIGEYWYET